MYRRTGGVTVKVRWQKVRALRFQFQGTPIVVNMADRDSLVAALRTRLAARQGFSLATINMDHLVKLGRSDSFRRAYAAQDLICADGNPIVWLSRLARRPVQLVTGSDMVVPMARLAAETGRSLAMVGSTMAALTAAAARLQDSIPGLQIGPLVAPAMGFDPEGAEARRILTDLQAQGVGLCLVALGAPKQEQFSALGRQIAPNVGFANIGAGLDFIAGTQTRAPAWVRQMALEWAWRALTSPRRMVPRYASCAAILPGQVWSALALRRQS